MCATISYNRFTPEVLDSYDRFLDFFQQSPAVDKIEKEAEDTAVQKKGNLDGRWQVAVLKATRPLVCIYTIFAETISNLLFYLGLTTWSIQMAVSKKLWRNDRRLAACEAYGEKCLAFAFNARAQNAWDVYLQPDKPVDAIGSSEVQELINSSRKKIAFYEDKGCCRGMAEWFLYLYFKTRHMFSDANAHAKAVGKQFEGGAPREAVLLQALCPRDRNFLGLERVSHEVVERGSNEAENREKITNLFKSLSPGAYAVGTASHRMNYICMGRNRGYFFNPNHGTIAVDGKKDLAKVVQKVFDHTSDIRPELLEIEEIAPC